MDNIRDENLKKLGKYIAEALIDIASENAINDWVSDNVRDNIIGELARCVTLQNLYLDREEYEKCAIMKVRIMELCDRLDMHIDSDLTNLDNEDEI